MSENKKNEFVDSLALKSRYDELIEVSPKDIEVMSHLQVRTTTDTGSEVDETRVAGIAAVFESGDKDRINKIDPVKLVRIKAEVAGGKDRYLMFDGHHTRRGAIEAKVPKIKAKVWNGTKVQAMHAAATIANREHESNGAPLTGKDKVRAVRILAQAYKSSDLPKTEWPSNRWLAERCGCSHQHVNNMDPFDRKRGDTRAEKSAAEKAKRAEANGKAGGVAAGVGAAVAVLDPQTKSPAKFTVRSVEGKDLAHYDVASPEKAEERFIKENPNHNGKIVAVERKVPKVGAAAGPAPSGYDWADAEQKVGMVARCMTEMDKQFDLKKSPEYTAAREHLAKFADLFKKLREAHSTRKK